MSHTILRQIVSQIQCADFYTIMVDECVDASNKEQLVFCLRHVSRDLHVHEDFIGLYYCPDITANTLVQVIKIHCRGWVLIYLNVEVSVMMVGVTWPGAKMV